MRKTILLAALLFSVLLQAQQAVPIIPQPLSLEMKEGSFLIDNKTSVKIPKNDKATADVVHFFTECVKKVSGFELKTNTGKGKTIAFSIEKIKK